MSATLAIDSTALSEPPRVMPPRATLFSERAQRFAQLARGHALADWLRFLGSLAAAQHEALQSLPAAAPPDARALAQARRHGMPPLFSRYWPRDAAWRDTLYLLATALVPLAPAAARASFDALRSFAPDRLEALADQVLDAEPQGPDVALLPFVGAALEVHWTAMAARLGAAGIAPLDAPGVCPCCGYLPVASIVRADAGNRRYLHCALCNTEWNLVRVTCAACGDAENIAYRQLEHGDGATRAETCDVCNGYLKIVHQGKDMQVDPVADDLASVALDVLVDQLGYQRAGPNLLFVPGAA